MTQVALEPVAHVSRKEAVAHSVRYVVSPSYDWLFFLAPPAMGMVIGALLGTLDVASKRFWLEGHRQTYVGLITGALVNAHLVAVVFRSHGNPKVFRRHPIRFLLLPVLVATAIASSPAVMVVSTVVVVFWDAVHSAMQTFGFARIYDARAGNAAAAGRWLDLALNVLIYMGPIVAGASMLAHFEKLSDLRDVGVTFLSGVPGFLQTQQRPVALLVILATSAFVAYYLASYARLAKRGYVVSWPKVWLLSSTGVCSVVTWGFNPWGLAFVIMNFFHAVQYLALVWWSEGARIKSAMQIRRLAPLAFLVLVMSYGAWAELVTDDEPIFWAIVQTVALMHFFYDGFIWSVRKGHV